jgi:hypothetical protein
MASDIDRICPHCGQPVQPRLTVDPLPLINDHGFISDLARFAEGIVSQQEVKKKYRLEESEWDALGENDALVRAVTEEKVRRIRNGTSAREKAQLKFIAAPDVLGNILSDDSASPRHRIEASRELRAVAAVGPEATPTAERFVITINLGSDVDGKETKLVIDKPITPGVDDDGKVIDVGPQAAIPDKSWRE